MARSISKRAQRAWDRLISWYGTRFGEQYGKHPPEDWSALIDRTDDKRLDEAMLTVRRNSPAHPPTLGQLEAAIPARADRGGKSVPELLCEHTTATLGSQLCQHQLQRPWNYFGDARTGIVSGVQIASCEPCGRPSHRVLARDLQTAAEERAA